MAILRIFIKFECHIIINLRICWKNSKSLSYIFFR